MTGPISETAVLESPAYNEAEVRFHIIDPIVRALGYTGRDAVYLKLEEKLNYPYFYIGRKNKRKDVPLGFPDYRAGILGGRGCFIIEAKGADVGLSREDVEQAHSYAAHAEVGADYFMLCDGLHVEVYETLSGPQSTPIVSLQTPEINARFHELENVLAPANLERHCRKTYDLNLKLGDGLGSSVKIRDGVYGMESWDYRIFVNDVDATALLKQNFRQLDEQMALLNREFELRVGDGLIRRDEDGRIVANVTFVGATKNNTAAMKLIGMDKLSFSTSEKFLSSDLEQPSMFESTADLKVAKGTKLPPMFGDAVPIDLDVEMDVFVKTRMYYDGQTVAGDYLALADYKANVPGMGRLRFELDLAGAASLRLMP